jgi:hypothetical protein
MARTEKSSTNIDQTLNLPTLYHNNASRFIAETILDSATPGTFLVRNATDKVSKSGGLYRHLFSLSIRVPEDVRRPGHIVKHYRIRQYQSNGWLELENGMRNRPQFPTIQSLVLFFGVCPPSRTDGVLLSIPCRRTTTTNDVNMQHSHKPHCVIEVAGVTRMARKEPPLKCCEVTAPVTAACKMKSSGCSDAALVLSAADQAERLPDVSAAATSRATE